MASGKTTLGEALHAATGRPFIDLDAAICRRAQKSISQIFADEGEAGFRRRETDELLSIIGLPELKGAIVACGGGTPCFGQNMELMLCSGTVVWLRTSPERTVQRVRLAPDQRPLLAGKTPQELILAIKDGMAIREPFYQRAHLCFDSTFLETDEEIAHTTQQFIKLINETDRASTGV